MSQTFTDDYMANSPTVDGPEMAEIRQAARNLGIWVVLGFSEREGASLYISQSIISGETGEPVLHRRKLKPSKSLSAA
jgi:nitrilase